MCRFCKRLLPLLLVLALAVPVGAEDDLRRTADYVCTAASAPIVGSVGGEWAVLGLARAGYEVPSGYYEGYCARAEKTVRDKGGVLSTRKYTEYSRVILALSSVGCDARSIGGHDLTRPLGDYTNTVRQGVNGAVFALLALDAAKYPMPVGTGVPIPATRQMYLGAILSAQLTDGGWTLSGDAAQSDITAMALQALAPYREQILVEQAVLRGITCLSKLQQPDGGFYETDIPTAESCAQVILALCALGLSVNDPRFVKDGGSPLDALLRFRHSSGGFRHIAVGGVDQMASEQALLALAALARAQRNENSLYDMTDTLRVRSDAVSFPDVRAHADRTAIEALALRGVVNGKGDGSFDPDGTLTRAEFAAILTRAFGLVPQPVSAFSDVPAAAWYAPYVGAAYAAGIVKGVGDGRAYAPDATITRQEAAVMLRRAAAACALNTAAEHAAATVDVWAQEGVDYCLSAGLLRAEDLRAQEYVLRGEMAQMVYGLMRLASML